MTKSTVEYKRTEPFLYFSLLLSKQEENFLENYDLIKELYIPDIQQQSTSSNHLHIQSNQTQHGLGHGVELNELEQVSGQEVDYMQLDLKLSLGHNGDYLNHKKSNRGQADYNMGFLDQL